MATFVSGGGWAVAYPLRERDQYKQPNRLHKRHKPSSIAGMSHQAQPPLVVLSSSSEPSSTGGGGATWLGLFVRTI